MFGEAVAMGLGDALDQAMQSQASQVIRHPARSAHRVFMKNSAALLWHDEFRFSRLEGV